MIWLDRVLQIAAAGQIFRVATLVRMVRKILIAVSASTSADEAVADGLRLAEALGASVLFLHVVTTLDLPIIEAPALASLTPEQVSSALAAVAASVLAKPAARAAAAGAPAVFAVVADVTIARCIANYANDHACDLILVGRPRPRRWRALLNSNVAKHVAMGARVPVIVSGNRVSG